jgi:hypothetical protein
MDGSVCKCDGLGMCVHSAVARALAVDRSAGVDDILRAVPLFQAEESRATRICSLAQPVLLVVCEPYDHGVARCSFAWVSPFAAVRTQATRARIDTNLDFGEAALERTRFYRFA